MIRQLSQQTAEQLCAQQVITSLPDCIKQLIDNAIDAGSTYIKITLTEYGKQRVEVVDNGFGINDFDFLGKKGSTSKNKGNDQFNYLGFRGEAIHSIGRVSQEMKIESKSSVDGFRRTFNVNTLELQVFKQERLSHGQFNFQIANKQGQKSTGTKVTIQGIFKKLPVRQIQLHTKYKDFLKKTNEIIKEFCLIYPEIQFLFINNREGKQEIIIETSAQKTFSPLTWLERIKEMDERIGNSLVYIQTQLLEGYVLNKIESGSSRQNNFIKKHYHYLFLNRRPIDVVTAIQTTLNEAYKKYNNNTKFAFLINLKLDHSKIDINLTPNKREIFIRKEVLEKIVKDLRDQIVEKVVEEIPTLSGFEDKKKGTQSQLNVSSQNAAEETKEINQRKTISFLPPRTEEDFKPVMNRTEQKNDFSSNRGDDKFSSFRQSMNVARSGMQIQAQSKKQVQSSKPKLMSDLPELEKVNVDMSKLKEQLNNRLSQNIGIIKRTSALPSSSLGPAGQPANSFELQQIRKENQEKKIREEQQDAKRRVDFLKEVKLQYSEEDPNKVTKPIADKYKSKDGQSVSARKNKDNQSIYEESQYRQNHSQKGEDDVEEVQRCIETPKQASNKQLEERIKAKINIDMSQIFVKFNNKNKQNEEEKNGEVVQNKAELAFFDQQHHSLQQQQEKQHEQQSQHHEQVQVQVIEQSPEEAPQQQPTMIDGKGNETTKPIKKQNFKDFEVIGQFNMGFILCLFNHQYFLVDQHAASEKFHYQKFLRQSHTLQSIRSQEKQEITGIQADQIEDCKNLLKESGFHYKITNRNHLQLQRCPLFYGGRLGLQYFWQIVEQKKELHRVGKFTAMCAMRACKTAVVVGNPLRYGEMRQIVNNLADLDSPWNCPHGRPTLVQLGRREAFRGKVTPIKTARNYDL